MKNYDYQLRALSRWEFEYDEESKIYRTEIDEIQICWNVEKQAGCYYFEGDLQFISNWDALDDVMAFTSIY